jgi:xylulokinase
MGKYLVGIDEGTTGCKTCIFDLEGKLIGSDYREYPCYYPKPAWVEQIPEDITPALHASCKAAIANSGIDPKEIIAMGLSSQGGVFGPVDKNGKLLRPFIGWQDLRGASYINKIKETMISGKEFYQITGYPLGAIFGVTKFMWLRDNEPELYEKTYKFSHHQDYFLREFGGEGYPGDTSTTSRTGLFDVDNHVWSDKVIKALGLEKGMFMDVVQGGTVVGKVTKSISEKTGLPEGTPVCVGAHDQNCSTFGCGLVEGGVAALVLGTWGSCYVGVDHPIRDPYEVLIVKGNVGPNNWTIEGAASAAASSYRWFRDTFANIEVAAGNVLGQDPYELINQQIAKVPAGSNGLSFLPYLQGASAGPRANADARGSLVGFTLGTTKAQIARAVMEGITFEMRDILEAQRRAGVDVESIRLTGGGTKSRLWNQMQADVYGRPVKILQTSETGCLGAALYAGVGTGVYKGFKEAADIAVKIVEEYQPNPQMFEAYNEAYGRFVKVYEALHAGGVF